MHQTQIDDAAPQGWRYHVGLIVTGEIAATGSIFFLGTEGFKHLKKKLFKFLKPRQWVAGIRMVAQASVGFIAQFLGFGTGPRRQHPSQ